MDLLSVVTEFREGILDGGSSAFMCLAVCAPLEGYLRVGHGVESHAETGYVWADGAEYEHFWLRLSDGRILDPTADQFPKLNLPAVYIGPLPNAYIVDQNHAKGREANEPQQVEAD